MKTPATIPFNPERELEAARGRVVWWLGVYEGATTRFKLYCRERADHWSHVAKRLEMDLSAEQQATGP